MSTPAKAPGQSTRAAERVDNGAVLSKKTVVSSWFQAALSYSKET